jgi:hypothetical protein
VTAKKLVELTEYRDEMLSGSKVYVNPDEVAAVREWRYHSFRPAIAEVVLQCGRSIKVWQDVETVMKRLNAQDSGKGGVS